MNSPKQQIFDCVVVGGGPAGATTAYHLARKGHSVLILEKHRFPRYKPCGGGVCPIIGEWFDFDFEPVISQKVNRVRCTFNMEDEVVVDLEESIWMVRRDEFDHYLVKQAQRQGAELWEESAARKIELRDNGWQIETVQGSVFGRFLVAADGANGPTARWLGFNDRKSRTAIAIETEPRMAIDNGDMFHFEFGLLNKGYVWNFPKSDGYSLGSGIFASSGKKARDLLEPLADYSRQFGVDVRAEKRFGHPILLWNGDQQLHTTRALLAGESACVVDPFTAEGIRPAIFSGLNAAEAVQHALEGEANALAEYSRVMINEWGKEMRWASRLAKVFYMMPGIAYRVGVKHPRGFQIMMDVFQGRLGYSDVVARGLKKISGGLL